MTEQEFIKQAEQKLFTSILTQTNLLLGQNKTAFLATGLFLNVQCKIEAKQSNHLEGPFKKLNLENLTDAVTTNIVDDKVVFTFLYKNNKHLKHLLRVAVKNELYFSYQYFKCLQSILRKHTTSAYEAAMFKIVRDVEKPFYLIDLASTYAINHTVVELLNMSNKSAAWDSIRSIIPIYSTTLVTEAQILADMAANGVKLKIKKAKGKYVIVESVDLRYITEEKEEAKFNPEFAGAQSIAKQDRAQAQLADQLQRSISVSTKGTDIGRLMNQLFDEIKIDSEWFTKLRKSFKTAVYNKTNDGYSCWENLSNTYRHIYTSPIIKNEDKKIRLILSLDTSGSIHTTELQKVLSIIKENSKLIAECVVMHHTTDVIRQFHLKHDIDLQLDPIFKEALNCRVASGGTSHKAVFKKVSKIVREDPTEWIYMAMSDFYSDVESVLHKYPILKEVSTYWIGTSDGRKMNPKIVGGTFITMP